MTEHHIHIHLSSQGTQAAQEVVAEPGVQAANPQYGTAPEEVARLDTLRATSILIGALIGREKGELSKETAVEIAKDIVDLLSDELSGRLLVAGAEVAAGYLMHGSGHYKKSTIAERAVYAVRLI